MQRYERPMACHTVDGRDNVVKDSESTSRDLSMGVTQTDAPPQENITSRPECQSHPNVRTRNRIILPIATHALGLTRPHLTRTPDPSDVLSSSPSITTSRPIQPPAART